MWHPLRREHLVLETGLAPDECARRIARTAESGGRALWFSGPRPVSGYVRGARFSVARHPALQIPLETWIAGRIGTARSGVLHPPSRSRPSDFEAPSAPRGTRIEIAVGPNTLAGLALSMIGLVLFAAALVATKLALDGVAEARHGLFISWMVVVGFVVTFFVVPAADHRQDRAFLIRYLCATLGAAVVKPPEEPERA